MIKFWSKFKKRGSMNDKLCRVFFAVEDTKCVETDNKTQEIKIQIVQAQFPTELAHELCIVIEAHFLSQGKRFQFIPPLEDQLEKQNANNPEISYRCLENRLK